MTRCGGHLVTSEWRPVKKSFGRVLKCVEGCVEALNKYWVILYKEVECLQILAFGGARRLLEIAPDDPP